MRTRGDFTHCASLVALIQSEGENRNEEKLLVNHCIWHRRRFFFLVASSPKGIPNRTYSYLHTLMHNLRVHVGISHENHTRISRESIQFHKKNIGIGKTFPHFNRRLNPRAITKQSPLHCISPWGLALSLASLPTS